MEANLSIIPPKISLNCCLVIAVTNNALVCLMDKVGVFQQEIKEYPTKMFREYKSKTVNYHELIIFGHLPFKRLSSGETDYSFIRPMN